MSRALGDNINVNLSGAVENHHPSSFEYAWLSASDAVKDKYVALSNKVPVETAGEKRFLLWLCGQEQSLIDGFMSIIESLK